ncbi:MAG: hypothetical protein Kow0059_07690 [Candidatus Sumerlaeia bacterium]
MECPYCNTINRDDQESCYHCGKDLSILRLIVNKAKHHYNLALENAERGRYHEAKAELQNALDLDRSHVKSWLALGTVYQRLGDYENAKKCWRTALEINPDFCKLHEYLGKTDALRRTFPVLRRFRAAAIVTTLLLIVFAVSALMSRIEQRREIVWENQLKTASRAFLTLRYDEAMHVLDGILEDSPPAHIADSANIIRTSIQRQIQFYLDQIEDLNGRQKYAEALQMANALLRLKPDEDTVQKVDYWRHQVIQPMMAAQIEQRVQGPFEQLRELTAAGDDIRVYQDFFPDDQRPKVWQLTLREQGQLILKDWMKRLSSAFERNRDLDELIVGLDLAGRQVQSAPELKDAFAAQAARVLDEAMNTYYHHIEGLIQAGRFDEAETAWRRIERAAILSQAGDSTDWKALQDSIRRRQQAVLLDLLAAAADRRNWTVLEETAEKLKNLSLDGDDKARLEEVLKTADRNRAESNLRWFATHLPAFLSNGLSEERAREAVERWRFIEQHPDALQGKWQSFEDDLLYCAARAYLSLGRNDQVHKLFDTLRFKHPDSPYLPVALAAAPFAAQ